MWAEKMGLNWSWSSKWHCCTLYVEYGLWYNLFPLLAGDFHLSCIPIFQFILEGVESKVFTLHKPAGCCTACFYRSVLFTDRFRRPSPHLNILLFSISVEFCPSRLCVLVTEERQMPAAPCAGGRDSLCWNLLEHLNLEGEKSWAREFPVVCSQ